MTQKGVTDMPQYPHAIVETEMGTKLVKSVRIVPSVCD